MVRWKFIWSVYLRRRISLPILLLDVNIVRDGWCIQRFSPSYLEICAYKINWNSDLQNIFNESICQFCVDKINGKSILQNRYCWSVRDMWSVFGSLEIRLIFNVIIIIIITRSKPAYACRLHLIVTLFVTTVFNQGWKTQSSGNNDFVNSLDLVIILGG